MKILKKFLKYLSRILIGALLALCVYALVNTTVLKKPYVNIGGYTFFIVASGSMSGTIDVNDMVIVKLTDKFTTNDIITYAKDGYFITHRVISTNDRQIITKGDVNDTEDEPITKDNVVGKVIWIFPFIAIFEILGSIILISIIIIVFNFEKIFKNYIFKKDMSKLKDEDIDTEDEQAYNDFVRQVLVIIRNRNNKTVKNTLSNNWIIRLRYVTKTSELLKMGKYEMLDKLVNSYEVKLPEELHILEDDMIKKLKQESINTFVILLLNTILYEDREAFDTIYYYFKEKINNEYCVEVI